MDKDQVYKYEYLERFPEDGEQLLDENGKKRKPKVIEEGYHSYNQLVEEIEQRLLTG